MIWGEGGWDWRGIGVPSYSSLEELNKGYCSIRFGEKFAHYNSTHENCAYAKYPPILMHTRLQSTRTYYPPAKKNSDSVIRIYNSYCNWIRYFGLYNFMILICLFILS